MISDAGSVTWVTNQTQTMMTHKLPRREFLAKTSAACMGGCLLLTGIRVSAFSFKEDKLIDPSTLCYCSYSCPDDCKFLEASEKNDPELKKAAFEQWGLKERLGLKFDPDKIFCFKCKPGDKPEGPILTHCTVRRCAIKKGYQACIQCNDLRACDKDLWTRFPEFHESIMKMQVIYRAQV
jgi:hypothetical protein